MSYNATVEYKRKMRLEESCIYYRGNGWPGKNTLFSDNRVIEYGHQGSLFERMFSSQIFKNPGCKFCKDHFAESADISFCDYWDQKEIQTETEGNSCTIIRTSRADSIFNAMLDSGYIEIVRELSEREIANTQMHVLKAKKGNLRFMRRYQHFNKLCSFIFKHRIYRYFGVKTYRRMCNYYSQLCEKSVI